MKIVIIMIITINNIFQNIIYSCISHYYNLRIIKDKPITKSKCTCNLDIMIFI